MQNRITKQPSECNTADSRRMKDCVHEEKRSETSGQPPMQQKKSKPTKNERKKTSSPEEIPRNDTLPPVSDPRSTWMKTFFLSFTSSSLAERPPAMWMVVTDECQISNRTIEYNLHPKRGFRQQVVSVPVVCRWAFYLPIATQIISCLSSIVVYFNEHLESQTPARKYEQISQRWYRRPTQVARMAWALASTTLTARGRNACRFYNLN